MARRRRREPAVDDTLGVTIIGRRPRWVTVLPGQYPSLVTRQLLQAGTDSGKIVETRAIAAPVTVIVMNPEK
jgi:hypothetical protein